EWRASAEREALDPGLPRGDVLSSGALQRSGRRWVPALPGTTSFEVRGDPKSQAVFSNGFSSHRQFAGRKIKAANMFTTNMKVSITPISAWNFRSDQI